MAGEGGFSTPLSDAVEALFASKRRPTRDQIRALCMVAWQAEYYSTQAPSLTGLGLTEALDDLADELLVARAGQLMR